MSFMARPRKHDREKLAEELVLWAKKPDSINLNKFCAMNLIAPSKIAFWAKDDEEFRTAYEIAKSFLAYRREELLNLDELHVKAYDLNATTYDFFLREERRQQAQFEAELKAQEDKAVADSFIDKYDSFMQQLEKLQGDSALRNADSNINNEQ